MKQIYDPFPLSWMQWAKKPSQATVHLNTSGGNYKVSETVQRDDEMGFWYQDGSMEGLYLEMNHNISKNVLIYFSIA